MKKIVIFDTALATTNLGDQVIYDCCDKEMYDITHDALIIKFGTHVSNYGLIQMFKNSKVNIASSCDYKLIYGTNLLSPNLMHRNPQFQLNFWNKRLYENCVLVGVGLTDYNTPINNYTKKLYKDVLSNEMIHSVRDDKTAEFLRNLGFKCVNTGCPTLWGMNGEKCKLIPEDKAENVVTTLSGYPDQRSVYNDRKLIEILCHNYHKIFFFVQTWKDEDYLREIIDPIIIDRMKLIYTLNDYKKVLCEGNIDYVGTRLHGGVFAMHYNVRSIIVSIDDRASGIHKTNNINIINRDDIESQLEELIYTSFKTDIKIPDSDINVFKSQFYK